MLRTFRIEKNHAGIVAKSTLFKALQYLDRENIDTPFLLVDCEKIREKSSMIGRHIKNSKLFYAVKANPDIEVLRFLDGLGSGFEIASEGSLRFFRRSVSDLPGLYPATR